MPLNVSGYEIQSRDARMYEQTSIVRAGLVLHLDASIYNTVSYGTTWFDLSGNGNNGAIINGPTFNSGNGGGIEQDGVNDYIEIPYNEQLAFNGNSSFTLQILAKTKTMKHNPDYPALVSFGDSSGQGGWFMGFFDDNNVFGGPHGRIEFFRFQSGGNFVSAGGAVGYNFLSQEDVLTTNNWCYTYSSSFGGVLYRNGVPISSDETTGSITRSQNIPLRIGTRGGNVSRVTSCIFYNMFIYNRALSQEEITHNYNVTKGRFGL